MTESRFLSQPWVRQLTNCALLRHRFCDMVLTTTTKKNIFPSLSAQGRASIALMITSSERTYGLWSLPRGAGRVKRPAPPAGPPGPGPLGGGSRGSGGAPSGGARKI